MRDAELSLTADPRFAYGRRMETTRKKPGPKPTTPETASVRLPAGTKARIKALGFTQEGDFLRAAVLEVITRSERLKATLAATGNMDAAE